MNARVTEKTDGFVFEVGSDETGFYCRSGTSVKMRETGDFAKAAAAKFAGKETYDPTIALWLDMGLHLTKIAFRNIIHRRKPSIYGEMILRKSHNPTSTGPNGTIYKFDDDQLGLFVIHTSRVENWSHGERDFSELKAASTPFLKIDDDIPSRHRISIQLDGLDLFTLEEVIQKNLPDFSKWGTREAEGFVIHLPTFSFKVTKPKIKSSLNAFLINQV